MKNILLTGLSFSVEGIGALQVAGYYTCIVGKWQTKKYSLGK